MSSVHSISNAPGGFTRIRPRPEHDQEEGGRKNIEVTERIISCVVGVVMICGLFQQSLTGAATAIIGAWLVYRGSTGHCPICSLIATKAGDDETDEESGEATEETEVEEGFVSRRRPATLSRRERRPSTSRGEDWRELEELPRRRKPHFDADADSASSPWRGGDMSFES